MRFMSGKSRVRTFPVAPSVARGMSLPRVVAPSIARGMYLAMYLTLLAAAPLQAQDEVGPAPKRAAGPVLYTFTDTTSVRVELTVPNAPALRGAAARGRIVSLADSSTLWSGALGTMQVDAKGNARLDGAVRGLKPKRWSPQTPSL